MDIITKKNNYDSPSIKVVSFKVEEGFQATVKVGDRTISTDEYPNGRAGTQAFGDGGSYSTVFGNRYDNSGD